MHGGSEHHDAMQADPIEEISDPGSHVLALDRELWREHAESCDELGVQLGPECARTVGTAKDDEGPPHSGATVAHHLIVRAHFGQGLGGMGEGGEVLHGPQASPSRLRGAYSPP